MAKVISKKLDTNDQEVIQQAIPFKSLVVEGTKYKTLINKKYEMRPHWEGFNEKKITAFIPGTISKIYVKEGKSVKAGEKLCVLDAMKMKNNVSSPIDGVIKAVYAEEGNRVVKNAILIELE